MKFGCLLCLIGLLACATARAAETTLQQQLDERAAAFAAKAPPERLQAFDEGVEAVRQAGVVGQALQAGATAPDFTLPDIRGGTVQLSARLQQGPVVLFWYRGGWCPYCNIQLQAMQSRVAEFEAAGARLIAVAPETVTHTAETAGKHSLTFDVLSDAGNQTARAYGLVYTVPSNVAAIVRSFVDMNDYNGHDRDELPLTAAYVIDAQGIIQYAFVEADYRRRAEPAALLEAVRALPATAQ